MAIGNNPDTTFWPRQQKTVGPVSARLYSPDPSRLIVVKSNLAPEPPDNADAVALWERNEAHPDGEIYISGPQPVQVALTARVAEGLNEGRLVEVNEDGAPV